jgi:hypothetical protein
VITGQQIEQYLWSQTRGIGISPREGKLPGGYFDQGEFVFRTGLSESTMDQVVEPQGAISVLPPRSEVAGFVETAFRFR